MQKASHQHAFTISAMGVSEYDDSLANSVQSERRDARIRIADYARHHGIHDPEELARFASFCVREADRRLILPGSHATGTSLPSLSIRLAAEHLGLRGHENSAVEAPAYRSDGVETRWVPAACQRRMPAQPLGELWTPASPSFWRRVRSHIATVMTIAWSKMWLN